MPGGQSMKESVIEVLRENFALFFVVEYLVIAGIALRDKSFRDIIIGALKLKYWDFGATEIWKTHAWVPSTMLTVMAITLFLQWSFLRG